MRNDSFHAVFVISNYAAIVIALTEIDNVAFLTIFQPLTQMMPSEILLSHLHYHDHEQNNRDRIYTIRIFGGRFQCSDSHILKQLFLAFVKK